MTSAQQTVLQHMADGDWYLGAALTVSGPIMGALYRAEMIRPAGDGDGYLDDMWTITPKGEAFLEGVV